MQKNNAEAIDYIVLDNSINNIDINISLKMDKKENIVYKTARIMSSIELLEKEIDSISEELSKERSFIDEKYLSFFGEKVTEYESKLDQYDKQLEAELLTVEKDCKKEKLLLEKLYENEIEQIRQRSLNICASDQANVHASLVNSLSESIKARDLEMLGILSANENLVLKLKEMEEFSKDLEKAEMEKENINNNILKLSEDILLIETELASLSEQNKNYLTLLDQYEAQIKESEVKLSCVVNEDLDNLILVCDKEIQNNKHQVEDLEKYIQERLTSIADKNITLSELKAENKVHLNEHGLVLNKLNEVLAIVCINSIDEAKNYLMSEKEILDLENLIDSFDAKQKHYQKRYEELEEKLAGRVSGSSILGQLSIQILELEEKIQQSKEELLKIKLNIEVCEDKLSKKQELASELKLLDNGYTTAKELYSLLKGKALLEYIAEEIIDDISFMASNKLQILMDGRYELRYIDKEFLVVDNFNEGHIRPVATLSGGEMFVVSLALALSISDAIVSRSNKKIEFFFLDEGFGTLDKDYCEYVVESLIKLANQNLTIGVISHIPELMERVCEKIIVEKTSTGTTIKQVSDI